MKRFLGVMIMATLSVSILAGCGSNEPAPTTDVVTESNETTADPVVLFDGDYATGIGIVTATDRSRENSADADGRVQVDSYIATVTVDSNGVIVKAELDRAQTRVSFDETGTITTDLDIDIRTKLELGPELGMINASPLGKEWYEQTEYFMEWVVGKTVEELRGMQVTTSDGLTIEDADLTSHVTISVSEFIDAIEKAVDNAVAFDASTEIRTGLGVSTNIVNSSSATAESDGRVQVDSIVMGITLDENDVILAASLDHAQSRVNIDSEGTLSGLSPYVPSKSERGTDLGMAAASPIGREWYEQAEAFTDWMIGKTVDEVKGLQVSEVDGKLIASDADLTSYVTVDLQNFLAAFEKAVANAR